MDLITYLNSQNSISLMQPEKDNQDVLAFMEKSGMSVGGIELVYDRSPDFSRLLRCQGSKFFTFIGRNKMEKIMGFFSISISEKWINGQKTNCGYIGDFRTDFSMEAAKTWRKAYAEILHSLQSDPNYGKPLYFLTAILKKNSQALRNLVFSKRDLGFRYHLLTEMDMVNVYGTLPWTVRPSMQVRKAEKIDEESLRLFLDTYETKKAFGAVFDFSPNNAWDDRAQTWPGFNIENFLLIKDENKKIIACTLPWNPSFAKRMKVTKASSWIHLTLKGLRLIGLNMPQLGQNLETLYLTHLAFAHDYDRSAAIQAFVNYIQTSHQQKPHMISFSDETGFSKKWRGYITQRMPVLLYNVSLSEAPLMDSLKSVSFEMGLV